MRKAPWLLLVFWALYVALIFTAFTMAGCGGGVKPPLPHRPGPSPMPAPEPPKQMCDLSVDYGHCLDDLKVGVAVECTPVVTKLPAPVPCDSGPGLGASVR